MRHPLSVLAVLFAATLGHAALIEVTADWLDSHALAVHAGDQARILGTETQRNVNLGNLTWDGGELSLVGCRLEPVAGRSLPPLPMVVSPGQILNLQQTWILGADTAIVVDGGQAILQDVTLASTVANIRSQHPDSRLELHNVNLCNAAVGLDLDTVDTVLIQGALLLTNTMGLRCGSATQIQLEDCLFQGNEKAIAIAAAGTPPVFLADVDLVDSRYALIENLSPSPVDLADTHVDEPAMVLGAWLRSGVDPGAPVHPLKMADNPIVIDDNDLVGQLSFILPGVTMDYIPCKESAIKVYQSFQPYGEFTLAETICTTCVYLVSPNGSGKSFFLATSCIGEWVE